MENQPFLLVELEDLSSIFSALKTSSRIKYTCFNVSNNFLIFGATSGGLYIFRRESCCFLHILPNKDGSITQIAISPDEKLIAFSTIRGLVCILEKTAVGAKHLVTTVEHKNEQVTCLQWNEGSNELFIGDNSGKVSIVTVSIFPKKSMFQNPSFVLMQLESKIVQMDFSSNMLLVSTLTKCYICDTTKEIFRQVGHKLRDGEYGACIYNTQINNKVASETTKTESDRDSEYTNLSHLKLLCARPGSRIWEVAIDGTVISTHHFKEALAVPPKKIHFLNDSLNENDLKYSFTDCGTTEKINSNLVEQSFNFQKLYIVSPKFFLTYKSNGIYIFDPQKASVVLWNNEITNIVDVKCVNDVIYVWSGYGKMYALNLVPLEKFLLCLYYQKKYVKLAKLCLEYESCLLAQANHCKKLHVLHDLDEKLKCGEVNDRLKPLINLWKENARARKNQIAQKLQSGIYLVSNNHSSEGKQIGYEKFLRPSYLNLKGRSHSVSPERLRNGESKHQGSCSSLPDLVKDEEEFEESSSPLSEVVVNGRKVKEIKPVNLEIDIEKVLKTLGVIKKSSNEPLNESIFNLFEQILALSECNQIEIVKSTDLVHVLPLNLYFNEEDVKLISNLFHSTLKSKLLFEWLSKFNCDWLSKSDTIYPDFLLENISTEDLELDYKLSRLIKIFSSLIKEKEIVELIKICGMKCYYASLNEILNIFHDSSISNINLANVKSTPKLLIKIYFLMTVGQMEQCSKYSCKVDINDMFYLMLKLEEKLRVSKKPANLIKMQCSSMFLSFLEKASEDNNLIAACSDLIELYVVNCLENILITANRLEDSCCSCGFPCPSLHFAPVRFPNVGHALLDKNWPVNPKKCLKICGRVPYLWRYLVFLHRNEPLLDFFRLLLQTGEIKELEFRFHEVNETLLEIYFKELINLKKGNCLNCNKKLEKVDGIVSWTDFGTHCVKLFGPKETLRLFKKYSNNINSKELYQIFYQSLIFSAIMERHGKGLRKNVVDLLTSKETEDSLRVSIFSEKLKEEIFGRKNSAGFNFQNAKFRSHHWGTKVNFKSNCEVCSLPLETRVLISEAGLIVFKCAHVFHSACVRKINLECPVCKKKDADGK